MYRRKWFGVIAIASLLMTGCGAAASESPESPKPQSSHTMADGTVMSGSEHEGHEPEPEASHTMADGSVMSGAEHGADGSGDQAQAPEHQTNNGPSEAARMVCTGQVVTNVGDIIGVEGELSPSSSWDKPMFTCTYEIDGKPLVLSVHDATDEATGKKHFADLQKSFDNAKDIEGMAGLGMPSFATGDGHVAFLRDGKTLLVDTTALPDGLGPNGSKTQHDAAYALASAVLVCWVDHA